MRSFFTILSSNWPYQRRYTSSASTIIFYSFIFLVSMVKRAESGDSIIFGSQLSTGVSLSGRDILYFNLFIFQRNLLTCTATRRRFNVHTTSSWCYVLVILLCRVDVGSVNSSGLLKAAVAREAKYTYQTNLTFKGATYVGMWTAGEPHGRLVYSGSLSL